MAAFNRAQARPLDVACHVHAPAQVIAAVRRRLPAVVVVREPEDTVLSFVIRHSHIGVRQALRGYVRFYEPLLPHRGDLVIVLGIWRALRRDPLPAPARWAGFPETRSPVNRT